MATRERNCSRYWIDDQKLTRSLDGFIMSSF